MTTIYVTHDQMEASALCDRVAFMSAGHIWQVDTYRNLLAWPVDLRVATFVADAGAEFVEGSCLEGRFVCPAFEIELEPAVLVRTQPGQGLTLRVAPQAVALVEEGVESSALAMVVDGIELVPQHHSQRIACRAGNVALTVEAPQDEPLRVGDRVRLSIDPRKVLVFDSRSGANLSLGPAR